MEVERLKLFRRSNVPPAPQGATTIQRGVRYIWDRRATARRLRLEASVTLIQAAIRMYVARKRYMRRLFESERASASFKVTHGLTTDGERHAHRER